VEPERLDIDFDELQVRKAYELAKIDQVMSYATIQGCRRSFLLNYFGERVKGDQCGACDHCKIHQNKSHHLDGNLADPVTAVKVLSGVARLKGRFGSGMAAKVLTGSKDRMIFQFKLHHLSTYGLLSVFKQAQVQDWIKELIAKGCIVSRRMAVGEKSYPVIELTDRGNQVMTGKELLHLSFAVEEKMTATSGSAEPHESEKEIFNQLRQLRSSLAKQEGLPPYCIFQDRTLREMARILPETSDELLGVVGVGEVTLRKYGGAFLGLLSQTKNEK
jgi:ATP-dependent DNA helicase RecQ